MRASAALQAFGLLRTNAYPAVPELNLKASTNRDSDEAWCASWCLAAILYGYPHPGWSTLCSLEEEASTNSNPIVREATKGAHRVVMLGSAQ